MVVAFNRWVKVKVSSPLKKIKNKINRGIEDEDIPCVLLKSFSRGPISLLYGHWMVSFIIRCKIIKGTDHFKRPNSLSARAVGIF